jgi:hypothetical protein
MLMIKVIDLPLQRHNIEGLYMTDKILMWLTYLNRIVTEHALYGTPTYNQT